MRQESTRLYDLRPLTPEDYPGWNDLPNNLQDRLGFARPLWRSITNRCGDMFADWVVSTCARYTDPWAQLKACVVICETQGFGNSARQGIAELLLPNNPPLEARGLWDHEREDVP